jgi:hypothetical protein
VPSLLRVAFLVLTVHFPFLSAFFLRSSLRPLADRSPTSGQTGGSRSPPAHAPPRSTLLVSPTAGQETAIEGRDDLLRLRYPYMQRLRREGRQALLLRRTSVPQLPRLLPAVGAEQVQRRVHVQQGSELRHYAQDAQELPVLSLSPLRKGGHEAQLGAGRRRQEGRQEGIVVCVRELLLRGRRQGEGGRDGHARNCADGRRAAGYSEICGQDERRPKPARERGGAKSASESSKQLYALRFEISAIPTCHESGRRFVNARAQRKTETETDRFLHIAKTDRSSVFSMVGFLFLILNGFSL